MIKKIRFDYIDQFRGLIVILMLVDHSSYYLNSIWKTLNDFDPLFPSWGQFAIRYVSYLCAPGFLIIAGAMVWWAYHKRINKGESSKKVKWHLIQRALFLVLLQMTWVNASWSGFQHFRLWHFGIISSIGFSILLLTLIIHMRWQIRLIIGVAILLIHPFLLRIPYSTDNTWSMFIMQTFIDAGSFNKYPVIPWFANAVLGSVMATGWLCYWKTDRQKILMTVKIASLAIVLAIIVRMFRGYGNIFSFSDFGSLSFFTGQKYPPSLFMNLWFFALSILGVALFIVLSKYFPRIMMIFTIPGRVPLFFYGVHIAILGVFVKRLDFFYREGGVLTSLLGVFIVMLVMLPLCQWYYGVKRRSNNFFVRMI